MRKEKTRNDSTSSLVRYRPSATLACTGGLLGKRTQGNRREMTAPFFLFYRYLASNPGTADVNKAYPKLMWAFTNLLQSFSVAPPKEEEEIRTPHFLICCYLDAAVTCDFLPPKRRGLVENHSSASITQVSSKSGHKTCEKYNSL